MQTKTYFASSVPAALEAARRELGDDAMLVTSKLASEAARPFGRLEVTFAYDPKPEPRQDVRPFVFPVIGREPETPPARPVRPSAPLPPAADRNIISELDELRSQISALRQSGRPALRALETRSGLAERLTQKGLGPDIADEIATAVRGNESAESVAREIAARIPAEPFPELKQGESRTLALVGPPGRGKTTSLIKIALRFGLAARVPVKIYSAGAHAVGGEDQMARYCSILGVPFQSCESLESIGLALQGEAWKGLVLIDTPGISPLESAEIGEFAKFFKRHPEIEKHLVLRADARYADIAHMIARYSPLEVSRLLFTGLDETVSLGSLADALMRTRIPACFAGTGQRIPEDLDTIGAARVARALCAEHASAAAA